MYNHQLDTFVQAADAGSFSKAAQALYITPTAVIKQINLLEARLGVTLFNRTHRGLTLTKAGESVYAAAQHIIRYSHEAVAQAREIEQGRRTVVRVGISIMTPSKAIVDLWPAVQHRCPQLSLSFTSFENTPENARAILRSLGEAIDIVAGPFDDAFLHERRCAALEISHEPIRCAMPVGHPLAAKKRLEVEDLHGQKLLLIHRGWNSYVDRMRDELWESHPAIKVAEFPFFNVEVFNQCANEGSLIMTIDPWENVYPLLTARPVNWGFTIPFGIMHARHPSEQVGAFLDAVAAEKGLDRATAEHGA